MIELYIFNISKFISQNNEQQTGGNLDLYKLNKEGKIAQPNESCELIKSIKPEIVKMFIF